jgi:lipopolysaccharide exporter
MSSNSPPLANRALHAAAWGYAGMLGKMAIQLGSQIVLARILGPETYGVFAIGAIVVGLSNFFADAGIGAALVQRQDIDDELIEFVQTYQWIAGLLVSGILISLAPTIAGFFGQPKAVNVIRAMAAICLLAAIASVPSNMLRRRLDFRPLQVAQISGFFVGYVLVGIPCAFAGFGVWSLVASWLVQAGLNTAIIYSYAKPPLGFRFRTLNGRQTLLFGVNALVSNIFTWSGANGDKVIVGRFFGASELGHYNVASNLLSTAISQVLSTLQSVLFAATSRVSGNSVQVASTLLIVLEIGAIALMPSMACIAAVPGYTMMAIYGEKWLFGADFLRPIALSMAMYGLAGLVTPVLWSIGRVREESCVQAGGTAAIAMLGTLAAVLSESAVTVAWVVSVCVTLRSIATFALIVRFTDFSWRDIAGALRGAALTTVVCASTFYTLAEAIRIYANLPMAVCFWLGGALTAFTGLAAIFCACRWGIMPALTTKAQYFLSSRRAGKAGGC